MRENSLPLHRFSVACLLEDLWRHVSRCPAGCGQDVELFLVHYARKTKVGNEKVGVVFGSSEQEIFGFEISVDDAVVVEICDCGESRADKVGSIRFVVRPFSADTVEKLATQSEVCDEVD